MTTKIQMPEGEAEFATKEEAFWIRCREASESRLKAARENEMFEEALIEMCNQKIKQLGV